MKPPPRVFVYGAASFNRASIPQVLADFEWLPKTDPSALSEKDRQKYEDNLEAYRLFVQEPDVSLREIQKRTGIHRKQLYLLLDHVVSRADDGLIEGLRGLLPHRHFKPYERTAKIQGRSSLKNASASGGMQQLLNRFPAIFKWLRNEAKKRTKPLKKGELRQVFKAPKKLHGEFLTKCREAGLGEDEWPFNFDYRGERSFYTYLKKLELETGGQRGEGADREGRASDGVPPDRWPIALSPFMVVQFDGHKIDVRVTIAVTDPFGLETLFEITRIWILVITDVRTRVVLGYSIALGPEYNKDDVAEALQNALGPHRHLPITIKGMKVKDGGGFPTELQPELAYHRWTWLQFDEAKAHLAADTLDRLNRLMGTWTQSGRLGEPNDRAFEERFFGMLEEAGLHSIPGTLGSNPKDPRRKAADVGRDLSRIIRYEELEQLVYVLIANLNGEPQGGVGGRTPLEAIRYFTSRPEYLMQTLPASKRHQLFLLREAIEVTIVGRKSAAHINFEGVRYTSDILARKPELIGQKLRIYYIARDIRKVHAFFMDGSELGILVAQKQWRTTPHSIRLRQEILRMRRLGKISWGAQDDPVARYMEQKRAAAKDSKRAATQFEKARQGIQAAAKDAAADISPFAPTRSTEPEHSTEQADAIAAAALRKPARGKVEPTPLTLRKTIIF